MKFKNPKITLFDDHIKLLNVIYNGRSHNQSLINENDSQTTLNLF
ncbi:MAG: hypothetical protein PHG99_03665 [Erysipelotrichaceae bacterium]|nr:hypothetical protein [Erysipelotrichaceae bacterium]